MPATFLELAGKHVQQLLGIVVEQLAQDVTYDGVRCQVDLFRFFSLRACRLFEAIAKRRLIGVAQLADDPLLQRASGVDIV